MKDFFFKHGNSKHTPQDAIETIVEKVMKIRELVYQEDELHLEEIRLLSEMLDDYARDANGYQFQKKDYQDVSSKFNPYHMNNHYYPMYESKPGQQGGQSWQGQPGQQGHPGQGQPQPGQPNQPGQQPQGNLGYRQVYPLYPFYTYTGKPSGANRDY